MTTLTFEAPIGASLNGDTWSALEIPGSVEAFGAHRAVRVDAVIDGIRLEDVAALATGEGEYRIPLGHGIRARLGKGLGETVHAEVTPR